MVRISSGSEIVRLELTYLPPLSLCASPWFHRRELLNAEARKGLIVRTQVKSERVPDPDVRYAALRDPSLHRPRIS
jgi:hypothetical protein